MYDWNSGIKFNKAFFFHSRQKNTFKHECVKICKVLGKMLCRSEPEKIEPTSDCIEGKKTCDCCCRPSCDDSKIVDECKEPTTYLPTEMTSKFNIMCESCHIRIVEFFVKYCYWCLILNLCFFTEIKSKFNIKIRSF